VRGKQATVIAWLWARTVKCPNPACGATMPLVRSFWLSTKTGKKAWLEPVVDRIAKTVRFEVKTGSGAPPEGTVSRQGACCIVCGQAVPFDHVRAEGKAGRMKAQLMAIVAEGARGRVYCSPSDEHTAIVAKAEPDWDPNTDLPEQALGFRVQLYGMTKHRDLFTPRQLVALTTFSDLVGEARERVRQDAIAAGLPDDGMPLHAGGMGAMAYADAVAVYLGCAVDRAADAWSSLVSWRYGVEATRSTFARQALAMVWDFAEANPFSDSCGNWMGACLEWIDKAITAVPCRDGWSKQRDAANLLADIDRPLISTDPPYYDNIGYADLSDFFYVWLRRSLGKVYPDLFITMLVPKAQELVATPYRFGGDREEAQRFFEEGLGKAFTHMRNAQHPEYPLTVYYAFKQAEDDESLPPLAPSPIKGEGGPEECTASDSQHPSPTRGEGESPITIAASDALRPSPLVGEGPGVRGKQTRASTGWETMLEGLLEAGFSITGTWPMRSERSARSVAIGTNALASSIVLVCRPRPEGTATATRREFVATLRRELPEALRKLQHGNIAPVDFAQATIGPGMAVFSRYVRVLEADGSPMRVRAALQIINQELDAYLAEQEGELDTDTRFCVAWFEQRGMEEGPFGEADVLARAKNTSVEGMVQAGVLAARAGKVRLLGRQEYPEDWDPGEDRRLTVWEAMQHLIRTLERGGEVEAARLANQLGGGISEEARALAYRLYAICERKGWAQEALAYNTLVVAWSDVQARTASVASIGEQGTLDF